VRLVLPRFVSIAEKLVETVLLPHVGCGQRPRPASHITHKCAHYAPVSIFDHSHPIEGQQSLNSSRRGIALLATEFVVKRDSHGLLGFRNGAEKLLAWGPIESTGLREGINERPGARTDACHLNNTLPLYPMSMG